MERKEFIKIIYDLQTACDNLQMRLEDFKELEIIEPDDIIMFRNMLKDHGTQIFRFELMFPQENTASQIKLSEQKLKIERLIGLAGGIPVKELIENNNRTRQYNYPRQMHMVLLHITLNMSLYLSGKIYGRDHSTVSAAIKSLSNIWETDRQFRITYSAVVEYCASINKNVYNYFPNID